MSEDKIETVGEEHEEHHHHHHPDVEVERIETVSSTTAPWTVRLFLGLIGIVLIGSAFAGWWFRDFFNGQIAAYLPYVIIGLVVLGVLGIVESITTEIWLALIAGVIALALTFLIVGRSQVFPSDGAMYVIDRFTGSVQFCTPDGCLPLKQVSELPKPPAPPPPPPVADPAAVAPAPAAAPALPLPPPPAKAPAPVKK